MLGAIIWAIIIILLLFLAFYRFYFLRDPDRKTPRGTSIISPADGKVMLVQRFDKDNLRIDKRFLGSVSAFTRDVSESGYIISIFMSVFDVHINRSPITGVVRYVKHTPGKFLNAELSQSTFENENVQILIQQGSLRLKVIQIAGLIARRIVCSLKGGDRVIRGQRIGLIKLGSQVTLILPKSVKIKVKLGEKIYAGETVIAEMI